MLTISDMTLLPVMLKIELDNWVMPLQDVYN